MKKRVQEAGTWSRGEKKCKPVAGLHGADDGNPSASAFRQTIFLPGGPKNGGGVRWVWRQFLVKKFSIFHGFL